MFHDEHKAWPEAVASIRRAALAGLLKGDPNGNFRPTDAVTRQELALIVDRMLLLETAIEDTARIALLKKVANQIVQVNRPDGGVGTGCFVAPGIILTNAHVVDGCTAAGINWPSPYRDMAFPDFIHLPADVVATDPVRDLAILRIGVTQIPPIEIDHTWALPATELNTQEFVGRRVYVQGSPLGAGGRVSEGIFNGIRGGGDSDHGLFDMDIHINPGNSGGPILDRDGQMVGVVFAKFVDTAIEGFGLGIPLYTVLGFLKEHDIPVM